MSFRRVSSFVGNLTERRRHDRRVRRRLISRQYLLQNLEDRRLLAGPELIAIRPDAAALLLDGDTLNVAPREFNLLFNGGANLDEATINSNTVKLVRSGGDAVFGDGDDIEVAVGYVGLVDPGSIDPADLQQIVIRPASSAAHNATDPATAFPDDFYQIQVIGSGVSPLTNLSGEAFNDENDLQATFRLDRGAQVVAVNPQPISRDGTLSQASDQIVVYFDDQPLDPDQVIDPAFYRLVNTATTLTPADDRTSLPQSVTYDPDNNSVVLQFPTAIPEGTYRLDVGQSGGDNSSTLNAVEVGTLSDTNPFKGNGYLGDFDGRSDNADDEDYYKLQLSAGAALTVDVEPHSSVLNLRVQLLDGDGTVRPEAGADVNAGAGLVSTVSFNVPVSGTYFVKISSADDSTGSYLIDASVTGSPLPITLPNADDNSSLSTATDLGPLGAAGITLSSRIERQRIPLPPLPGSEDEPGHRQIQREAHIGATGTTPTVPQAIRTVRYYFPSILGTDTSGNSYSNLITETEKEIVRGIFEIYAQKSGYEFIEVEGTGQLKIGKGDFRAVSPSLGPNDGVAGLASGGFAVLNGAIFDQANRFFGDGFTGVMFHEIGHSLGLSHSYDLPSVQGTGIPNDVLPGDHDIVHLQRIVPPNSTDIDLYRFELAESGRLQAETVAERLGTPSLLNSVLTLYREAAGGKAELVARNDQYFGADSFLDLELQAGTYFIGVSSTGNTQYDPHVSDSGFGGTTDGAYDLKLKFEADRGGSLVDESGTAFDGDADGRPGGLYSFWFQSSDPATAIYVDKMNDTVAGVEGTGSLADPYDTISAALADAGSRIVVPADGATSIMDGEGFVVDDGLNTVTFRFGTTGLDPVDISGATDADDVADAIGAAIATAKTALRLSGSVNVMVSGRVVKISGIDNLDISGSPTLINTPNLVHIVGNGGSDGDLGTVNNNRPYLVGLDTSNTPLADGAAFLVPQGVNVMIHEGVLLKLRSANLDAGSSSVGVSRSQSSIQVLGTPLDPVLLRSYHNDAVGGDSDGVGPAAGSGDFGGIVFRDDSDLESSGVFLNYVNHADINNGGGKVFVDADELVFTPIYLTDARPTISFNRITFSDSAAISASPDSFDDSMGRIGPDVYGNFVDQNTIDGLSVRVLTPLGSTINKLTVSGRFDDTDITHVLSENLIIAGAAGGPLQTASGLVARAAGRLALDPGTVLKLNSARIEAERGAGSFIAEGTLDRPVIITSVYDDRFGGSGSYVSDRRSTNVAQPGDWGGLFFGEATFGSIDNAIIAFGGGSTGIEGGDASFNAIEVHQADVRVANSLLQSNASGSSGGVRNGRGRNAAATIYVRGAQPVIVNNVITDNSGAAISINANALRFENIRDPGRSTGTAQPFDQLADNHGPLVRLNRLENNGTNGMRVRGEELTTESIWDDTDIVHVLQEEIKVDNLHSYGGLTLQSSNSESLVIKLADTSVNNTNNVGFTATGTPVEIIDRVGGTIHVLGTAGHPVVLTHLADDSVGAGFTPRGTVMTNTNNSANPTVGASGEWRGFLFDEFSNDRNVAVLREREDPLTNGRDVNSTTGQSQFLGTLAPDEKSGDENRRLGFDVTGFISLTDPDDVDVYSFRATAGTGIWIDIDRTDTALDAIIEVVNASGTVVARSIRSGDTTIPGTLNAPSLTQNPILGGDHYTQNFRDPGLFFMLPPGPPGVDPPPVGTYYVRVRSNPASASSITSLAGDSRGEYQLQIRLRQVQEFPGSTIQFADIRYAQTGIDVRGLPAHSPLQAEAGELAGNNNTFDAAQALVNLLETDIVALGISGVLSENNGTDVDWYSFDLNQTGVQVIPGVNDGDGTMAVVFDLDYSDNAVGADTTVAVFDQTQRLIYVGRESNVLDDQPDPPNDPKSSVRDLSRGSLGKKDPFIGPVHLVPGNTYYVAVMSDRMLPAALTGAFVSSPTTANNTRVRLEPVNSVQRVIEDHIGTQGYDSNGAMILPSTPEGLFSIDDEVSLGANVTPFSFEDVVLYVATDIAGNNSGDALYTVDPFAGGVQTRVANNYGPNNNDVQDIVIRSDGRFFGYQRLNNDASNVGNLVEIDPQNGNFLTTQSDNILDRNPTPNLADNPGNTDEVFNDIATTDDVDALTYERRGTTGSSASPNPTYDLYYAVRETDGFAGRNSKLYRANASNGSAERVNNSGFGEKGDIQPSKVSFARTTVFFNDGNGGSATVIVESKIPGAAGSFTLTIIRADAGNTILSSSPNSLTIRLDNNPHANAGAFVDLINNTTARQWFTAAVDNGATGEGANNIANGATFIGTGFDAPLFNPYTATETALGLSGPLNGRVTGLAFGAYNGGQMYGVTAAGEFLAINKFTGDVLRRFDLGALGLGTPTDFQGLALGPQNVEDAAYANTLFAITSNGTMYAIDVLAAERVWAAAAARSPIGSVAMPPTAAELLTIFRPVFAGNAISVNAGVGNAVGLAFSPLDFNLWHPTTNRGGDVGHGVNVSPDDTREAAAGGTSFYFGFDQYDNSDPTTYLAHSVAPFADYDFDTDLDTDASNDVVLRFLSNLESATSDGQEILISKSDLGSGVLPQVAVNATGQITIVLNTDAASAGASVPSTADDLIAAVAGDPTVSGLIRVRVDSGTGAADITTPAPLGPTTITLATLPGLGAVAQFGVRTRDQQIDLSSNTEIRGTYNFPAGALGSLVTNPFSLAGSVASDRPTLYFNYFLDTQDFNDSPFRDSARVFASRDDGLSWELLATNDSTLGRELPAFLSHLSDAGLNSASPTDPSVQIVQELFDNSGGWRQARVDLSTFANESNLKLRFDFSTAGAMGDPSLSTEDFIGPNSGELTSTSRSIRSLDNKHEGFFIDDIIIGYAERGEMVTGTVTADSSIINLFAFSDRTRDDDPDQYPDILNGEYQLEVRRTDEYVQLADPNPPYVAAIFDTNDRHINEATQTAAVTFEPPTFNDGEILTAPLDTTLLGGFTDTEIVPWSVTSTNPFTGAQSLESGPVMATVMPVSVYQVTRADLAPAVTTGGVIRFAYDVSSAVDEHGLRFYIDGVAQNLVTESGETVEGDPTLASGEPGYQTVQFPFGAGNPTFSWVFDFTAAADDAEAQGDNRAFVDAIQLLQGGTGLLADRNRDRAQGILIVDSNFITDSSVRGINVQPGTTQAGGGVPHPGSTINFPQLNTERLVPGIVVQNNVIAGSSGIRFAGETTPNPQRPVPYGRLINNTLVGDNRTGTGIEVVGLASPTILNNLLTDLGTGVNNGGTGTVIKSNFFQNNASNGSAGTDAIISPNTAPLFVDAANGNYYLQAGSNAIDSSRETEQDRQNFLTFKNELGIPASPINAPSRDVYGQLRIAGGAPGGGGSTLEKDRGAVDRSDKDAPYAVLLNPIDNEEGQDRDPNDTVVQLTDQLLDNFTILLGDGPGENSPFEGTGVDSLTVDDPSDPTISMQTVTIIESGRTLVEGVDYSLGYNPLNGTLLLTPLSTLWNQESIYTIILDNSLIADRSGNLLRSNQADGSTRFTVIMPLVEVEFGDAPVSYGTLVAQNGARHAVSGDRMPRLGRFLDTEADGQPFPSSDDAPLFVTATGSGLYDIDTGTPNTVQVTVNSTPVVGGETITLMIAGAPTTFELVAVASNPRVGNVPVPLLGTDPAEIAASLADAINDRFRETADALIVSLDSVDPATFSIVTVGDEDGVSVGTFIAGTITLQVFTEPGTDPTSVTGDQVLGFINPLDPGGTNMAVTATGSGLLDMWVDFDGNGTFEPEEQMLVNEPVVDGVNLLTIFAPIDAGPRATWMRFRISEGGNLGPTGLAVGGEVEDYPISVLPIGLPTPVDDEYNAFEDTPLNVLAGDPQGLLLDNDSGITGQILPVQYFIGAQPANGTVTVVDRLTGAFTYTPDPDFYGQDTFTYRLSTQQNNNPAATFANVTINVAPVNDLPRAQDQLFIGTEDTTITITAGELLVGAAGHEDPQVPIPPLDESDQAVRVVSVTAGGITISGSNPNAVATTLRGGSIAATFAVDGTLTEVFYTPATDFNRDNLPLLGGPRLDEFDFTVEDDGVLVLPTPPGGSISGTSRQQTATAQIEVTPQNDPPLLRSDFVSISDQAYLNFYSNLGVPARTPTEDAALIIPARFLLANDLPGPVTAADENTFVNGNDGPLTISGPVAMVDPSLGTIELLPSGDLLFTPTADVYGGVLFTYSAFDQGMDEAIDGTRVSNVILTTVTSTIFLEPINDPPVAFDRSLTLDEIAEPGAPAVLAFDAADLIVGGVGDTPAAGGDFAATLPAPYDEIEQLLRVVSFGTSAGTVDVNALPGGTGTLSLPSDAGGLLEFNFVGGAFVDGVYAPPIDYNALPPFDASDLFTFTIADDGMTSFVNNPTVRDLPDERSLLSATVTLTVTETNDPPVYQTRGSADVLERDDSLPVSITGFVFNQTAGPLTALDELALQTLSFEIIDSLSTVPDGLMLQTPTILPDGTLTLYPAPDQFGTAVYTVRGTDSDPTDPRSTDAMFTVNVRPVNDAPRFDPAVAGTSGLRDDDEAYEVASFDANNDGIIDDATITYTLREDNTQASGDPTVPYFIPLTAAPPVAGYSRIGLLDVFNAGPPNEEAALPGGSQTLELFDFPLTTSLGGQLNSVFDGGVLTGLHYTPPVNFNNEIGGDDSFVYTIRDDSTTGGETWSLGAGGLVPDRLTATNQVRLNLNPVNDRPEFTATTRSLEVPEDSQLVQLENFASSINAGPPTTAFDEVDILTGQQVRFEVTPAQAASFFSVPPNITPDGTLSFRPAANVFGEFEFEIVLSDDGPDDATRGDLVSSLPVMLTISVQPINDPPAVDPLAPKLSFALLEDGSVDILIVGDSTVSGLLDPFTVGPVNEAADILPEPGGNQTIRLGTPVPATTAEGGTLIPISDASGLTRLRYQPRANFTGMDSFIYTVTDDGTTVTLGSGGSSRPDPRIASNTVTLEVVPVNDAPQFSGAGNVASDEDAGVVTIDEWATNVQVGPATAFDEIDGDGVVAAQTPEFLITQISSNTNLFLTPPSAIVDGDVATLTYVSAPNANGVATFEVRVRDDGPTNLSIGDDNLSDSKTFTIRVNAVNDPPSFTPGGVITVNEDSGPFNEVWARNISPGPFDEFTQSVRFEVSPVSGASLFGSQPQISAGGVLRFTPATNANGVANVEVTAIDSEDGTAEPVTLQIVINEVNDPPVPQGDSLSTNEDAILAITSDELLVNDLDPDLITNPLEKLRVVMPARSFSVSGAVVSFDAATGLITYDPTQATAIQSLAPNQSLTDSFSYSVRDADPNGAPSSPVVVTLKVDGINDKPVLEADNPTLNPNGSTTIPVLANDSDVDGIIVPSSIIVTLQPAFGSLQIQPDGTFIYTPFGSFNEEDQFRYSVADNLGLRSDEALVTISANAAPIARDDARGTFLDEAVDINVAANDFDPDTVTSNDPDGQLNLASIVIVKDPVRGEAIPQGNGTVRYLPEPGFIGNDSFTYTIADTEGRVSNVARVDTQVVASRLQNPDEFSDVNDDGRTSGIDALLIINHLSRSGNVTSIPVLPGDRGPNYYDVNGNQSISAADALRVIDELGRRDAIGAASVEAEFVSGFASQAGLASTETAASFAAPDSAFALAPAIPRAEKVVDATAIESVAADVIDLIADDREQSQSEDASLTALDEALVDFEWLLGGGD